jgi:hypothetical protein
MDQEEPSSEFAGTIEKSSGRGVKALPDSGIAAFFRKFVRVNRTEQFVELLQGLQNKTAIGICTDKILQTGFLTWTQITKFYAAALAVDEAGRMFRKGSKIRYDIKRQLIQIKAAVGHQYLEF